MSETIIPPAEISPKPLATVLTVAGSDSSGGAGIEADIKAITANGVYALTAITALTAQNTVGVNKITFTDKESLQAIFDANFQDIKIDVIKTGLLTPDSIDVLSQYVSKGQYRHGLVIDPVLIATTGAELAKKEVLQSAIDKLIKHSVLLTPNVIEAQEILRLKNQQENNDTDSKITSLDEMKQAAKEIQQFTGTSNVLLKGGHIPFITDNESYIIDVLYSSETDSWSVFKSAYIKSENTHGTGCTLASTISANLAKGFTLYQSIESAIQYIKGAISSAPQIGHGNGPLNHVYNIPALERNVFAEGKFIDFLVNHPQIKPVWDRYVNHEFVSKVADGTLKPHKYVRFLQQDYPYLVHYSRIHALALSVAPDVNCINREVEILTEIKHELSLHTEKLKALGYSIEDFNNLKMSEACQNYADYLLKVAQDGDWLEINVALAPCLIGYNVASENVEITTDKKEYKEWLLSYRSDWYKSAVQKGKETLERHSRGISFEKIQKLIKIYADVSLLEVKFWDDSLYYNEEPEAEDAGEVEVK